MRRGKSVAQVGCSSCFTVTKLSVRAKSAMQGGLLPFTSRWRHLHQSGPAYCDGAIRGAEGEDEARGHVYPGSSGSSAAHPLAKSSSCEAAEALRVLSLVHGSEFKVMYAHRDGRSRLGCEWGAGGSHRMLSVIWRRSGQCRQPITSCMSQACWP